MSASFTPGPWVAREWNCHAATSVGRASDNLTGFELIAECSGNGRQVSSEQEVADARLIAAAPMLLEALQDLYSAQADPAPAWTPDLLKDQDAFRRFLDDCELRVKRARDKARAAIAAATGENRHE